MCIFGIKVNSHFEMAFEHNFLVENIFCCSWKQNTERTVLIFRLAVRNHKVQENERNGIIHKVTFTLAVLY